MFINILDQDGHHQYLIVGFSFATAEREPSKVAVVAGIIKEFSPTDMVVPRGQISRMWSWVRNVV